MSGVESLAVFGVIIGMFGFIAGGAILGALWEDWRGKRSGR